MVVRIVQYSDLKLKWIYCYPLYTETHPTRPGQAGLLILAGIPKALWHRVKAENSRNDRYALKKEVTYMGDLCAFLEEEDGVTVVEIILVLLVLIALVLIFKEQLTKVVKSILSKVSSQADSV